MEKHMQLPALNNTGSVPVSVDDFVRNSNQNLQRMATAMPDGGIPGALYLGFDGNTGQYKLNKVVIDPESIGRILTPQHGFFEGCNEWANGAVLQRVRRPMLGVHYDEPMSESLLEKPLSPQAYRKGSNDGPTLVLGFMGFMLDDGATVVLEHSSKGTKKNIRLLATAATQAVTAFGELVHPVIELGSTSYKNNVGKMIFDPKFTVVGYVTDKRAREVDVIEDGDIMTRPTASRGKVNRQAKEGPAL
jgi:hypothetical protein